MSHGTHYFKLGLYHARSGSAHIELPLKSFAWYDYREGLDAGYNQRYWEFVGGTKLDPRRVAEYNRKLWEDLAK